MAASYTTRCRGEDARDDGAIIVHVGDWSPTCIDCGTGTLAWAEAGHVPWHRICTNTQCGSHWDLHPLGQMGIGMVDGEPCLWGDGVGWVPIDHEWRITQPISRLLAELALREETGRKLTNDDGDSPLWGDLLDLIRPEHRAAATESASRTLGVPCIPACWARRARFY